MKEFTHALAFGRLSRAWNVISFITFGQPTARRKRLIQKLAFFRLGPGRETNLRRLVVQSQACEAEECKVIMSCLEHEH